MNGDYPTDFPVFRSLLSVFSALSTHNASLAPALQFSTRSGTNGFHSAFSIRVCFYDQD